MKYLFIILFFLIAIYAFTLLNFYSDHWLYVQPMLIAVLLVYYNISQSWLYYSFASLAGLFVDSLNGIFGLQAIIFVIIIFILRSLQLTLFTSKNILTIILLTILAFIIFWLLLWSTSFIFNFQLYFLTKAIFIMILRGLVVNTFMTIFLHILFFNFWLKKQERH